MPLTNLTAADVRAGDTLYNRAGEPMFTVAAVDHLPGAPSVVTVTTWDMQRGWTRLMEIQPTAPVILSREVV